MMKTRLHPWWTALLFMLVTLSSSAQWTPAYLNVAVGQPLDLVCTGDSTFLLFTDTEELLRTTDLGATWSRAAIGVSLENVELRPSGWGLGIPDTLQGPPRDSCIWQTRDGGRSWRKGVHLGDIPVAAHYLDDTVAIVVGRRSLHRSFDSGETWFPVSVPDDVFHDALMIDRDHIILVGHCRVYRTTNGGGDWKETLLLVSSNIASWCLEYESRMSSYFQLKNSIVPIGGTAALLLVQGLGYRSVIADISDSSAFLFRTSDSGESWEMVYQPERRDRPENWGRILFADSLHGMIAPALINPLLLDYPRNEMIVTSDGGRTWTRIPQPGPTPTSMRGAVAWNRHREGIFAVDEATRYFDGRLVHLIRFRDPGGSGDTLLEYGLHTLRDIAFAGDKELALNARGAMVAVSNGPPPLSLVLLSNEVDGNWIPFSWPILKLPFFRSQSMVSVSPAGKMLVSGWDTSRYYFSEDLGRTWTERLWKNGQPAQPIRDYIFMDDSTVIMIDNHCVLWRWSLSVDAIDLVLDIGRQYRPVVALSTNDAQLWRLNPTTATAFVLGEGRNGGQPFVAHFLTSHDGGRTWTIRDTMGLKWFTSYIISMPQPLSWLLVNVQFPFTAKNREILFTKDGGASWAQIPFPYPYFLVADVVEDSLLYVVADRNFYVSSNFGQRWERRSSFPYRWATKIGFTDRENGWVLTNHALLTTTNGGVTWAEPVPPAASVSSFSLPVTYPNPASSSSTAQVEFTLERDMSVGVFVYDLLGRRQRVLHEGRLPAGPQRFTLGTAGLPPGLYFVTVSTPEGVRVGKVVVGR